MERAIAFTICGLAAGTIVVALGYVAFLAITEKTRDV
jgi:hypothetical protein